MNSYRAIVIGCSAGGLDALERLLCPLPAEYPLPIMVVMHCSPHVEHQFHTLLNQQCQLTAVLAREKARLTPGKVFIAPPDYHLLVERSGDLSLSVDEKVHWARPSIDVLFDSAADAFGPELLAILLTGANTDGVEGLSRVIHHGGETIVQNPATAEVSYMPQAAVDAGVAQTVLDLDQLSLFLTSLT
uniref:protein-glutamate methylesterase n=1 Tax=Magnetococcus massalia (strain MO-1) TaxID=451514 RepID=A0A1S7LM42_MAGMO|nr:Signal transduction response regulator, chemotaxis, protein-glutamate methylesterase [Candidatus Magnetococcus massalia]